jgi:protein TonB
MLPPAFRDENSAPPSTEFRPACVPGVKPRAPVFRGPAAGPPIPAPPPAARSAPRRTPWIAAAAGAFVLLAAGGAWFASHARAPVPAGAPPPPAAAPIAPVEADSLTGPADSQPRLKLGAAPRSPEPDAAVVPTIVCRVLVDERGRVGDARIFRSRLDLASFEDAALAAVRGFVFEPARRAGAPVPVWVNWPVTFE